MSWEKSTGSAANATVARQTTPIVAARRWGEDGISCSPSEDVTGFNVVNRGVGIKTLLQTIPPQHIRDDCMSDSISTTGILLVGHGTRDETGTRQFLELVEVLKERLAPAAVEAAFLELREPGIGVGVQRLLGRGIERLATVPLLLFAAGHIKRDVPEEVENALFALGRGDLPRVQVGHLGCHESLVELSRMRMEEGKQAQDRGQGTGDGGECLLLVARGSSDGDATQEMRAFARMRASEKERMRVEVAFLAMAKPGLVEQLGKAAAGGFARVIVQPHFLFEGELVERIRGQIAEMARIHPETAWVVAPPLADPLGVAGLASNLLTNVILGRLREAGIRVVGSPGDD